MHRWRGTILRMFVFRPQNTVRSRRDERRAERGGCRCFCGASRTISYLLRRSCLSLQLAVRAEFSVRYGMKERGRPLHPERSGGTGNRIAACRAVGYRMAFSSPRPGGKRCGSSVPCGRSRKLPRRKRICLKKAGRVRSGYEAARVRRPATGPERPTLVLIRRGKADGESFPTCRNRPISGRCRRAWP